MVGRAYVPDAGDLVWLTFDPQSGRLPALILSPRAYNAQALLALACPVTSLQKGYPFEVEIPPGHGIAGVVLADHVKVLEWEVRGVEFDSQAPAALVAEVRERLRPLLGL